jgi:hypothetical protein
MSSGKAHARDRRSGVSIDSARGSCHHELAKRRFGIAGRSSAERPAADLEAPGARARAGCAVSRGGDRHANPRRHHEADASLSAGTTRVPPALADTRRRPVLVHLLQRDDFEIGLRCHARRKRLERPEVADVFRVVLEHDRHTAARPCRSRAADLGEHRPHLRKVERRQIRDDDRFSNR